MRRQVRIGVGGVVGENPPLSVSRWYAVGSMIDGPGSAKGKRERGTVTGEPGDREAVANQSH